MLDRYDLRNTSYMYFYGSIKLSEHKLTLHIICPFCTPRKIMQKQSSSSCIFRLFYLFLFRLSLAKNQEEWWLRLNTTSYNDKYRSHAMRKGLLPKLFMYKRITWKRIYICQKLYHGTLFNRHFLVSYMCRNWSTFCQVIFRKSSRFRLARFLFVFASYGK